MKRTAPRVSHFIATPEASAAGARARRQAGPGPGGQPRVKTAPRPLQGAQERPADVVNNAKQVEPIKGSA